jgi:hypothetical protein
VPLWWINVTVNTHHRDTENTEVAQGISNWVTTKAPGSLQRNLTDRLTCYFEALGEALPEAAGEAVAAGLATGEVCGAGVGVASGAVDCKTECEPVTAGRESISAISMKAAAAPIVILDKILAVPRGPNAVLETLLEKRSPAPDLPGCNRITTTSTIHDRMNSPYKV